jgi:hypothetical protein
LNRWYFMEVKSFKHFLFNIYCVIDWGRFGYDDTEAW